MGLDTDERSRLSELFRFCEEGNVDEAKVLLNEFTIDDVNRKRDKYGWSMLSLAAVNGHAGMVEHLLKKEEADPNQRNKHDRATPLLVACRKKHLDVVQLLLDNGAKINIAPDKNGLTPLLAIICSEDNDTRKAKDLIVALLKTADPNETDKDMRTPLHFACYRCMREMAKLLIEHGAKNLADKKGITPFHYACRHKWEDVVDSLLKIIVVDGNTQLLHVKDHWGRLPIHYLVHFRFDRDNKRWNNVERPTRYCLLSALLDIEKKNLKWEGKSPAEACHTFLNPEGSLPLNLAVNSGSAHCVEMLTLMDETNYFALKKSTKGYLPIHRALATSYPMEKREVIIMSLLQSKKIPGFGFTRKSKENIEKSLRTPDPNGNLPLHLALQHDMSNSIIKLLLDADTSKEEPRPILTRGPDGLLPIHIAMSKETIDHEIVMMLLAEDMTGDSIRVKETNYSKLAIHLAFGDSLPSIELLRALLLEDGENNTLYLRDGEGAIALHYLLRTPRTQSKEDDSHLVKELVQEMLLETKKTAFETKKTADGKDEERFYSPLILMADGKTGMLPLHMALQYGAPLSVINLLLEYQNRSEINSVLSADKSHKLPLHYAVENPSTDPSVIFTLLQEWKGAIYCKDATGQYPLEYALKLDHATAGRGTIKTVLSTLLPTIEYMDFEEGSKLANLNKEVNFKTIFNPKIEKKTAFRGIGSVEAFDWLYRACQDNEISDSELTKNVLETLDSKITISWMNKRSSQKLMVFLLMADFYVHCTWIGLFLHGSAIYIDKDEESTLFATSIFLLAAAVYFLFFRELIDFVGSNNVEFYLTDMWNWIELCTIVCVAMCSWYFLFTEFEDLEDGQPVKALIAVTGLFQFVFLISFLRTTFLAYAQFVGGIVRILRDLVPFLIVTFAILAAFTHSYYISLSPHKDEDGNVIDNFGYFDQFQNIFEGFVGGPSATDAILLDVLFGIASVVILLNVVIAIVGNSWNASLEESTKNFWTYRLDYIEEVAFTKDFFYRALNLFRFRGCSKTIDRSSRDSTLSKDYNVVVVEEQEEKEFLELFLIGSFDELEGWYKVRYILVYTILVVLGLVTFGLLWPEKIRNDIFGSNAFLVPKESKSMQDIKSIDEAPGNLVSRNYDSIRKAIQKVENQVSEANKKWSEPRSLEEGRGESLGERVAKVEENIKGIDMKLDRVHSLLQDLTSSTRQG